MVGNLVGECCLDRVGLCDVDDPAIGELIASYKLAIGDAKRLDARRELDVDMAGRYPFS